MEECTLNFVVPSERTLDKALQKYKIDSAKTGILQQSLMTFAKLFNGKYLNCQLMERTQTWAMVSTWKTKI